MKYFSYAIKLLVDDRFMELEDPKEDLKKSRKIKKINLKG